MAMDPVVAVWSALYASKPLKDLLGKDMLWDSWLFQDMLQVTVEQSARPGAAEGPPVALVVSAAGSWTAANTHNSMRFPRVRVEVYADPQRDLDGNVETDDCVDKLLAVFEVMDPILHRTDGSSVQWGGTRVLRSSRLDGEPEFFPVLPGDGLTRMQVYYGLGLG